LLNNHPDEKNITEAPNEAAANQSKTMWF